MLKESDTMHHIKAQQLVDSALSHMVRPQGFGLDQLRRTLSHSAIRNQCYFVYGTNNVLEIILGFEHLLSQEQIDFGALQLAAVHVTGIMVFMLHHENKASTLVKRTFFLQRCFDYMACTEGTHVNHLVAEILNLMNTSDTSVMMNLIVCCRLASPLSSMARVVGSCVMWSLLDRLTDLGLDTHRLRPCNTLLLVVAVVNPRSYLMSYLHALHLVVRLVTGLLLIGPLGGNAEKLCHEAAVPVDIMVLSKEDAGILFRWAMGIVDELRPQMIEGNSLGGLHERLVLLEAICELMQLLHTHMAKCQEEMEQQPIISSSSNNNNNEASDAAPSTPTQ